MTTDRLTPGYPSGSPPRSNPFIKNPNLHHRYLTSSFTFSFYIQVLTSAVLILNNLISPCVDPSGLSVCGLGLRPLVGWDCGFESRRRHGCLSLVNVACCQVQVSATGRPLPRGVLASVCVCVCVCVCDRKNSHRSRRPTRAVEPQKKIL